jgi:hypothetical protein
VAEAPGVAVGRSVGGTAVPVAPGVCEKALYVHAGPEAGAHAATAVTAIPAAPMAEPRIKPRRDRADDKADDKADDGPDVGACELIDESDICACSGRSGVGDSDLWPVR